MCLRVLHNRKEKQKVIDQLKVDEDGYVSLYKVVHVRGGRRGEEGYWPRFRSLGFREYKKGLDKATGPWWKASSYGVLTGHFYKHGFYFTTTRDDEEEEYSFNIKTIICKVKKEWITATGVDEIAAGCITIIAKKAIFPKEITCA